MEKQNKREERRPMPSTAVTIEIVADILLDSNEVHLTASDTIRVPNAYNIPVETGDKLVFSFPNTPDYKPAVVFNTFERHPNFPADKASNLGVFDTLEQDGDRISGVVGMGAVGKHTYWIWLVPQKPGLSYHRLLCPKAFSQGGATIVEKMPPA